MTARANSIKVTLMQCESLSQEVFKFPARSIVRKYLGEYLSQYENESKGTTKLNGDGSRD